MAAGKRTLTVSTRTAQALAIAQWGKAPLAVQRKDSRAIGNPSPLRQQAPDPWAPSP